MFFSRIREYLKKKLSFACVLSAVSCINMFGVVEGMSMAMDDVPAVSENIGSFCNFLEEHRDEFPLSPENQEELRQRFIDLEPSFTAMSSWSNKDIYDHLKPFILSLDNIDMHGFDNIRVACLTPEDYIKAENVLEEPGYWDFDSLGGNFMGNGDYVDTNKTLLALCRVFGPFLDEMTRIEEYFKGSFVNTKDDIRTFLQDAAFNKDFTPLFFIELEVGFRRTEQILYYIQHKQD